MKQTSNRDTRLKDKDYHFSRCFLKTIRRGHAEHG